MKPINKLGDAWPFPAANDRTRWHESTRKHYWYSLEVLPPIYFPGGFFVSEPSWRDEQGRAGYAAWVKVGERYFVRETTRAGITAALVELREALDAEARAFRFDTAHSAERAEILSKSTAARELARAAIAKAGGA